jgi:hypothetical protein
VRLSRDGLEALLLLGGFAFVAAVGLVVFLLYPTHIHGNARLYLALIVAGLIAVPTVLHLRQRLSDHPRRNGSPDA